MRYFAQFSAPFRGRQEVRFDVHPGDTADGLAREIVQKAREQFNSRWPLCGDAIYLAGLGDRRTGRVLHNRARDVEKPS